MRVSIPLVVLTVIYALTLVIAYVVVRRLMRNTRFRFCGLACDASEVKVSTLPTNLLRPTEVRALLERVRLADRAQRTENHVSSQIVGFDTIRDTMPRTVAALERMFEGRLLSDSPHRMFARLYNKRNDYMNWHYDDNLTVGSKLTALVPLHVDDGCNTARFEYMDQRDGDVRSVNVRVGQMVMYDGENVYHRVTVQRRSDCERLVLVLPLYTDSAMTPSNRVIHLLKSALHAFW